MALPFFLAKTASLVFLHLMSRSTSPEEYDQKKRGIISWIEDISILKVQPISEIGTPLEIVDLFGGRESYLEAIKTHNSKRTSYLTGDGLRLTQSPIHPIETPVTSSTKSRNTLTVSATKP